MPSDRGAVSFAKGHGTANDFVLLPDPEGALVLDAAMVARICDRRTGLGADGVLRVVRTDAAGVDSEAEWFMDYRNADGSFAEMCGNGARVFARYLLDCGWVVGEFDIATRSGLHHVTTGSDGTISVTMGKAADGPSGPQPTVSIGDRSWSADAWWLPNPHAVVFVDDLAEIGDLQQPPQVAAGERFPAGQNVEFVVDHTTDPAEARAAMRVFERGVGETMSCGTGACAVALSLRMRHQIVEPGSVKLTLPGGVLRVVIEADQEVVLNGPAEIVGRGTFDDDWWRGSDD